jgi:hypothetical protein
LAIFHSIPPESGGGLNLGGFSHFPEDCPASGALTEDIVRPKGKGKHKGISFQNWQALTTPAICPLLQPVPRKPTQGKKVKNAPFFGAFNTKMAQTAPPNIQGTAKTQFFTRFHNVIVGGVTGDLDWAQLA